jgi:hypothetical protein
MRSLPKGEITMRSSIMLQVSASFIAAVLAVASSAPRVQAQDLGFAAKINVPFAFQTASGQHFAPGIYTIKMSGSHSVVISSNTTLGLTLTQLAYDGLPTTQGKAVFTHYGDQYFLRAVWVAGNTSHLICDRSKAERAAQTVAGKANTGVEVALLKAGR